MKKSLIFLLTFFLSIPLFGHSKERLDPESRFIYAVLKAEGCTMLPEVVVTAYYNDQDTIKHKQQRFSSIYETKGGRGYLLPDWANDSTWYPGQKPPIKHKDKIVDTLVKENSDIQINNYYSDDPFFYSNWIGRFYHGGFNYWYYSDPFYYNPWFYNDFWWDYGWGWNPYYGYNYPYGSFYFGWNNYWGWNWGWNWNWIWYHPYYYHNNYYHNNYYHNNYYGHSGGNYHHNEYTNINRRQTYSTLSNNNHRIQQPNSGQKKEEFNTQGRRMPNTRIQDRPVYNQNRRSYRPSYEQPRMSERPQFNNSKMGRDNMNRSNMQSMPNSRINNSIQNRTYLPPLQRSYSAPGRSNYNNSSRSIESGRSSSFGGGGHMGGSGQGFRPSGSSHGGSTRR